MSDIAVDVRGVSKRFRLAHGRHNSLKERVIHGGRTPHEDFWALSGIVRTVDAISDADNDGGSVFLHTGIDPASMVYMAKQRALRGKEKLTDVGRVESAAILWVDGFTMGYLLAQGKAPSIQQLLDESIDGAHRSPRGD